MSGYYFNSAIGACELNTRSCVGSNGTGTETWTGSGWSSCVLSSCSLGYHLNPATKSCDRDVQDCSIANGTGTQIWNGSAYGACTVKSCNPGTISSGDTNECLSIETKEKAFVFALFKNLVGGSPDKASLELYATRIPAVGPARVGLEIASKPEVSGYLAIDHMYNDRGQPVEEWRQLCFFDTIKCMAISKIIRGVLLREPRVNPNFGSFQYGGPDEWRAGLGPQFGQWMYWKSWMEAMGILLDSAEFKSKWPEYNRTMDRQSSFTIGLYSSFTKRFPTTAELESGIQRIAQGNAAGLVLEIAGLPQSLASLKDMHLEDIFLAVHGQVPAPYPNGLLPYGLQLNYCYRLRKTNQRECHKNSLSEIQVITKMVQSAEFQSKWRP